MHSLVSLQCSTKQSNNTGKVDSWQKDIDLSSLSKTFQVTNAQVDSISKPD